jgi:hypothetical protein
MTPVSVTELATWMGRMEALHNIRTADGCPGYMFTESTCVENNEANDPRRKLLTCVTVFCAVCDVMSVRRSAFARPCVCKSAFGQALTARRSRLESAEAKFVAAISLPMSQSPARFGRIANREHIAVGDRFSRPH